MSIFSRKSSTETFDAPTEAVEDISGDYTLDPSHSRLGFSARHAMVTTVRGSWKEWSGTAHIDSATPGQLDRLALHRHRQRRHRLRGPRRPPVVPRLLRRRGQPGHHLRLTRHLARRLRLDHHR